MRMIPPILDDAADIPGVLLPEGIIFKQGDLGATTRFRVSRGVEYDHSGKYMAVGPVIESRQYSPV